MNAAPLPSYTFSHTACEIIVQDIFNKISSSHLLYKLMKVVSFWVIRTGVNRNSDRVFVKQTSEYTFVSDSWILILRTCFKFVIKFLCQRFVIRIQWRNNCFFLWGNIIMILNLIIALSLHFSWTHFSLFPCSFPPLFFF